MNYEKAKEVLNGDFTQVVLKDNESHSDVFSEAFHMAIEALEKQIPKKHQDTNVTRCPACNTRFEAFAKGFKYCPYCGQAIDWNE